MIYTCMEASSHAVVGMSLVQVTERTSSVAMEKRGLQEILGQPPTEQYRDCYHGHRQALRNTENVEGEVS